MPVDRVIKNEAALLKPGGWIQLVELNMFHPPADTGPVTREFLQLLSEIMIAVGVGDFPNKLKTHLIKTGLEDVSERRVLCPVGKKLGGELGEGSVTASTGAVKPLMAVAKSESLLLGRQRWWTDDIRPQDEL